LASSTGNIRGRKRTIKKAADSKAHNMYRMQEEELIRKMQETNQQNAQNVQNSSQEKKLDRFGIVDPDQINFDDDAEHKEDECNDDLMEIEEDVDMPNLNDIN